MLNATATAVTRLPATSAMVLEPVRSHRWPRRLLTPGTHRIGSSRDNDFVLEIPGVAASHVVLDVTLQDCRVTVLDPRTWLNDGPVKRSILKPGDRLTIGPCTWRICSAEIDDLLGQLPAASESAHPAAVRDQTPDFENSPDSAGDHPSDDLALAAGELISEVSERPLTASIPDEALTSTASTRIESDEARAFSQREISQSPLEQRSDQSIVELVETAEQWLQEAAPTSLERSPSSGMTGPRLESLIQLQSELDELRSDLDRARAAWRAELEQRELQMAEQSAALTRRTAAIEAAEHEFALRQAELQSEQRRLNDRSYEVTFQAQQLHERQLLLAAERDRLEAVARETRDQLAAEAERQRATWEQWQSSQQRLLVELTRQQADLEDQTERLQHERRQSEQESGAHHERERQLQAATKALHDQQRDWHAQRTSEQQKLSEEAAAVAALAKQVRAQQDQLAADLREQTRVQSELRAIQAELQQQRQLFAEQQLAWVRDQEAAQQDLTRRRQRLDHDTEDVARLRAQLEELHASLEHELIQTQHQREQLTRRQEDDEREKLAFIEHARALSEVAASLTVSPEWLTSSPVELDSPRIELVESQDLDAAVHSEVEQQSGSELFDEGDAQPDVTGSGIQATDGDFDAIQEALAALATRFEEFGKLEQRLQLKHDELLQLQQELDRRDEELSAAQLVREQAADLFQQDQLQAEERLAQAWAEIDQTRLETDQERSRWLAHFQELKSLVEESQPSLPSIDESQHQAASDQLSAIEQIDSGPVRDEPAGEIPQNLLPISAHHDVRAETVAPYLGSSADSPTDWGEDQTAGFADEEVASPFGSLEVKPDEDGPGRPARLLHRPARDESVAFSDFPEMLPENDWNRAWSPGIPPTDAPSEISSEQYVLTPDTDAAPVNWSHEVEPAETSAQPYAPYGSFGMEPVDAPAFEGSSDLASEESAATLPSSETPAEEVSLRLELAKMFNLPENFAGQRRLDEESPSELIPEDEAVSDISNSHSDTSPEAPCESWRDGLRALIDESAARRPRTPEPVDEPREPEPAPTTSTDIAEDAAPAPEAEDSVAAYMERLLARTRRSSGATDDEPSTAATDSRHRADEYTVSQPLDETPKAAREPVERRKIDRDATRAELQSFREVANLSARSALAKHSWRTVRTEFGIQSTIAGLCTIGLGGYLISGLTGGGFHWGPLTGCGIGAVFVGYRAWTTQRKLQQWAQSIEVEPLLPVAPDNEADVMAADVESAASPHETATLSMPPDPTDRSTTLLAPAPAVDASGEIASNSEVALVEGLREDLEASLRFRSTPLTDD